MAILLLLLLFKFFTLALADDFWLEFKWQQVSRTLLSILTNLNNAVVWTVSTHPIISKSSSLCTNPLLTVPRAPITIGIIVTFIFYSFFNSQARFRYLSYFSFSFTFTLWSAWTAKSTILQVLLLFCCCWLLQGLILLLLLSLLSLLFSLQDYRTRVSWWSFTGVWAMASLLRSPALFSVFWSILRML